MNDKLTLQDLPGVLEGHRSVKVIDIDVWGGYDPNTRGNYELNLSWFNKHESLENLAVRVHGGFITAAFSFPTDLKHLKSLTLDHFQISAEVILFLPKVPLQTLFLRNCWFARNSNLVKIAKCSTLRAVNLEGTTSYMRTIQYLAKMMPQTTFVPAHNLVDYADLAKVLTTEKLGKFSISKKDIETITEYPYTWELFRLGDGLEEHCEGGDKNSHAHNCCDNLRSASPIQCLDDRVRVAVHHPEHARDAYSMWRYVICDNVKLILMLREEGDFDYYPDSKGESLQFDNIKVTCEEVVKDEKFKELEAVLRKLNVCGQTVYHLQLYWAPWEGINVETLAAFMEKVEALEAENPGQTLVHCQAGKGRTGTYFATLILKQLMKNIRFTDAHYFNLDWLLLGLRQQRYGMIESESQMLTIILFLRKLIAQQTCCLIQEVKEAKYN